MNEEQNNNVKDAAYWEAFWNVQEAKQEAHEEQQSGELCAALEALGVTTLQAFYNGSGDQGCVVEIIYKDANGQQMELTNNDLETLVDEVVCSILPDGWELNEGSSGNVIINVAERKLAFDHDYFVEANSAWEEQWPTPTTTP